MKKLTNLKGVKTLNKNEQKNILGSKLPICDLCFCMCHPFSPLCDGGSGYVDC